MHKYLLSLVALLLFSVLGSGYMIINIEPFTAIYFNIALLLIGFFLSVFSFVTLFLFFLAEVWNKKNSGEICLKKSARRGFIFALFSVIILSIQLFRWLDFTLAIGIFFLFLFIEIYFSFLKEKNHTF